MKTAFSMLIPFIGILSILVVQQVAIKTAPVTTATVVAYVPPIATEEVDVDSSLYATPEELGKLRGEYRHIAKGGLKSAEQKGQKIINELDTYILGLDKKIDSKKQQIADREKLLSELKSTSASKPVVVVPKVTQVPVNKPKQPSQEEDDENY